MLEKLFLNYLQKQLEKIMSKKIIDNYNNQALNELYESIIKIALFDHYGYLLPSDSSLRLDLINFIKDDQEKSQIEKEKIEADAERDINLRKKNSN